MFTEVEHRVNREWVFFVKRMAMGQSLCNGLNTFENIRLLKEAMANNTLGLNDDLSQRTKDNLKNPEDERLYIANLGLVRGALLTMGRLKEDLKIGVQSTGFDTPTSIFTGEKLISMRWVLHVAREDGMSPEEAYAYGLALTKK